ncbi:MAG: Gfo/Idh/MocA family oxidoreductase [Magnetococcales bacterium]|nr:Gfo/Idh/MocA family oxidoreductase [Magnetococcales bacterium]NGZ05109.1 Gfo/Idh/MocA family oxidoreductase [Magnetococcales bacterium]
MQVNRVDFTANSLPNVAVVGTGYWGKNLVRNFHRIGALRMICDADQDHLNGLTAQYSGVRSTLAYSEVLNDPAIHAVVIATPASTHAQMVREALLAGKDLFVEKPLCLSATEGVELHRLAVEQGRILMVGHLLWYHPAVLRLKEMVDAGELGQLRYIYSNRLNMGKLRREENVLWSFAPHDISIILGLVREMPDRVIAHGGNFLHRHIADTTMSLLSFPCGVQAHVFVSWLHPFKEQKLVVVGERQMAVFDDTAPWTNKLVIYSHSVQWNNQIPMAVPDKGHPVSLEEDEPLRAECLHFLECVAKRQTPRTDAAEGLRVLTVLNACQNSLENGKMELLHAGSELQRDYFLHPTAQLDERVEVGSGSKIWHFSHILPDSRIGRGVNIGQNVVIGPRVIVGNGCKIQNNVSIYEGVILEDEVFCGPSMVFTNVTNPRAYVSRKHAFAATHVGRGCTIGANATIVCGHRLGEWSFIAAGAVVTRDVPAFAVMAGNPARRIGWMSRHGEKLALPVSGEAAAVCPVTGERYILEGERVRLVTDP